MIEPTVGRVVWYWPLITDGMPQVLQPLAAIVTHVHDDRLINVCAFRHDGMTLGVQNVRLIQDGDHRPAGGHFTEWMPYQKGQAAKTEALEAQIDAQLGADEEA